MNEDDTNPTAPTPPNGEQAAPPPLTPAMIEKLMARTVAEPQFRALLVDEDLGPVCTAIQQIVRGGPEPLSIMIMFAAWGLLAFKKVEDAVQAGITAREVANAYKGKEEAQ